jgi:hypothetical protein
VLRVVRRRAAVGAAAVRGPRLHRARLRRQLRACIIIFFFTKTGFVFRDPGDPAGSAAGGFGFFAQCPCFFCFFFVTIVIIIIIFFFSFAHYDGDRGFVAEIRQDHS